MGRTTWRIEDGWNPTREIGRRHPPSLSGLRVAAEGRRPKKPDPRRCAPPRSVREIQAVDRPRPARRGRGHAQKTSRIPRMHPIYFSRWREIHVD